MKKIIALTWIMAVATFTGYAQYDMGDAEMNDLLASIMNKFKAHTSDFRYYVTSTYAVHPNKFDYWQADVRMTMGDIFLTVEIAKVSKKSQDDVIASFKVNKTKGWGAIAKDFGVTPGTRPFEDLKDHAYKLANGTNRPKPKPVIASKPAQKTTKPTAKQNTKKSTKTTTKSTSTTKPKTTTTKPKAKT